MKRTRFVHAAVVTVSLATFVAAQPAYAIRGGGMRGPRGGSAAHVGGPYRGATAVQGPRGGTAVHTYSPRGGTTAVRGPYGGGAVAGHRGGYAYGAHAVRPGWGVGRADVYRRGFVGYPGWRAAGMTYGLVAPLAAYSSLAFLSAGLLLGSYSQGTNEVYVYVVQEDGQDVQYQVDSAGNVVSRTVLGPAQQQ